MTPIFTATMVLLALAAAFTIATYVLRARVLYRGGPWPEPEPLGWLGATSALVFEIVSLAIAAVASLLCWPLLRWGGGGGSKGTILLLHDWGMSSGSMLALMQRLRRSGWNAHALGGQRLMAGGIASAAEVLAGAVATQPPDQSITLIGHGAGGVVARYYAHKMRSPQVQRIITLGSPYRGTEASHLFYCGELRPGGELQRELYPDTLARQVDVIALHSSFDALVLPPVNALYPNAFNIQLSDVGHYSLLFSAKVFSLLRENLDAPLPEAGAARFTSPILPAPPGAPEQLSPPEAAS